MVISGDDGITLPMIAAGCRWSVFCCGQCLSKRFCGYGSGFAWQGNLQKHKQLHYKYTDIISSMFAEGSPSGVKAYLS